MIPVFETVRVEDGRVRLRERHLERLARAGAPPERVAEAAAILDEAVLLTDQPFVLRIDVDDAGAVPSTRPVPSAAPADLPLHVSYDPACDDRLEADARGVYCGSVFAFEPARQALAASIAIRTAVVSDGEARYGAGGAVTLLSDPAEEAEETLVKARPFLRATGATLEGWE